MRTMAGQPSFKVRHPEEDTVLVKGRDDPRVRGDGLLEGSLGASCKLTGRV
jgi:hypothetical protein